MASADVLPAGGGVDLVRIATFLSVPDETILSLSSIAESYIASILQAIAAKANDFDELRADKLRVDVELEQSVRTADSRVKSMKGQLDSTLVEMQELRLKVSDTETARASLENELARYKDSRTSVDDEARNLKVRVQTLESDKRDTLEALDRKCTEYDNLQEEYTAVQHKNIAMRRELGSLETKLQQTESAQSNAKFRVQSLEQELEMIKKNNEWLDSELKTKVSEHQKFRKEKAAQVSRLNSELEEALSNVDMLKRTMDSLKERYEEVSNKAEDRLAKIKDLQGNAASQEESFRQEINSQKRLAELYEKAMNTTKARVAEVEKIMEQELERFNFDVGHANSALETERTDREDALKRVAELEFQVEKLEGELAAYASGAIVSAGEPHGSQNGASTPTHRPGSSMGYRGTPGSPIFSPAAGRLQKQGVSVTQLYADYNQLKARFETEKRRNTKLEAAMDDMVQEMEERAPELQELRDEHARMEKDLVEMSKLLEEASKGRDVARREARKTAGKIADFERETACLRKQLRDLSMQIQILTVEIERRDAGAEQLSAHQNRIYEEIINGNLRLDDQNDTDALISQRLVAFRNVQDMQEQNANLLLAIRELGSKMEKEEQDRLKDKEVSDNEEIQRLEGVVQRLQDEIKSIILKSQTFVRERDMFRRMLQNKGELANDGQPTSPAPASDAGSTVFAEIQQNLAEALRNLQSQYDQFKTESMENQNIINDQNRRLTLERGELEIQVARVNSQLEMASERYEMLNGNFNMLKSENQELQKRLTHMHEAQAKQDLKTQQTVEELVDKNSLMEGIRTENANLKAEKALWKSIEQRLSQDNESLTQERARLNGLISNLQSIQSEHERSDSEARRRLVSQAEKLENELQATKRRLNEEMEQAKKNLIRKEKDQQEAQRRYGELNANFGTAKEELVAAKTSRDHLQARVNELTLDLKVAEEKLSYYQEKPAPVTNEDDYEAIVEELKIEITDLGKEIEVKDRELKDMKEQVERFKAISMANEEQLEENQIAYDQYKESMEQELAQRENTIRDLQQRVEDMSNELTSVNQELSETQKSGLERLQQFENEKAILNSQLHSLQEDLEKTSAAAQYHQDDLRCQAGIAQEAQQNYERELVKHAEATQVVQQLRAEYAELKNEMYSFKTEAETAKASLSLNESSWETQREKYEKELKDVIARCDDLAKQNRILHGQFESVNEQMVELKKERAYKDEAMEISPEDQPLDKCLEELREVIRYLRQEKEIVDAQFELSLQETKRLKQQLDNARNQLDEVRAQLSTEQQKQADQLRGVSEHKEIMEKISELNLLRESNSALRYDGEKKGKKVAELTTRIEELGAMIQPLEQAVRELEAEKEAKDGQMRLLSEDNERWKTRTQQILQKYDRVDPAELEELKQKAATLETERNELQQKLQVADSEKDSQLQEQATKWRGTISKLRDDANSKIGSMRTKQQELTQEVEALRQKLEEANRSREQVAASGGEELQRIWQERERLQGEIKTLEERATAAEGQSNNHRAKAQQFYRELNQFKQEKQQAANELQALRTELEAVKAELEVVKAREKSLIEQLAAKNSQPSAPAPEVDHSALIESEVQRRVAEIQSQQVVQPIQALPVDNSDEIEAEVQRRVAKIQVGLEAEVQRRIAELQSTEEGEVVDVAATPAASIPVETTPAPAPAPAPTPQVSEEEIETRVQARVEEVLPARMKTKFAEKEKILEDRIKTAQLKFQDYKAAAVKKAVEDTDARHKVKEEALQQRISDLEAEVEKLKIEIEQLNKKISELESQEPAAGTKQEDLDAALVAKDAELVALKEGEGLRFEEAKEALRVEIQAEILAIQHNIDGAEVTPEAAAARDKEKEKLKAIITRNVEHRLNREKEKWMGEVDSQRESVIEEKVQAALKEKLVELEARMKEKEATLKAEMEKSKDAIRQEGVMRSKVQINMLERKNKALEDKLKAQTGGAEPTPALPQTGLRRPSHVGGSTNSHPATNGQPAPALSPTPAATATSTQSLQAAQQAAIAAAEQAISAATAAPPQGTQQRRSENQGTGPAALRQLRGALVSSGIPRGGAGGIPASGRGRGSPPLQAQPPQVQNPFAPALPQTGIPNPFAPQPGQGQGQGRGGSGRGVSGGRGGGFGRGRGQVQTTGHTQVQQQGMNAGSPTRGAMNPGARQFVPPGSKRGREGDEEGGTEKRPRSSVGGAPPASVAGGGQ